MPSRRDFLKNALIAGAFLPTLALPGQMRRQGRERTLDPSEIPAYRFKTISIDRWPALKVDFEKIRTGEGLSRQGKFRESLTALDFSLPRDFSGARSVVILATFAKSAVADFLLNGKNHRILIPFQYYGDEWTPNRLKTVIQNEIIKNPDRRLINISKQVPLKYLAGRSGLGSFGRNNLIYVDGMGSYCLLHAFLTDAELPDEPQGELQLLDACRRCHMCDRICPTDCMSRTRFVIDAGRCISLANENPGEFPNGILPSMHHALMGCLKCQTPCPENSRIPDLVNTLEAVSEEMTRKILRGQPDDALLISWRQKLRLFPDVAPADFFPILKRNLSVLIRP